jgi:cobalt-zinc-cadmium efflux system outer membrane protein
MSRALFGLTAILSVLPVALRAEVPSPLELPATVTLEYALQTFRSRGLDLLLAEASVAGGEADLRAAKAILNPQVNVSRGSSRNYDPTLCPVPSQCSDVSWSGGLSDQGAIFDLLTGKHHLRVDVATKALLAAKLGRADAERTLVFALKQQYLAALLAKASLAFAGESRETSAETLRLVGLRYKAGAVSEADVARAEALKLEADQAVDQATQELREAKVDLAFMLGARALVPDFDLGDEFQKALVPPKLEAANEGSLVELGLRERPDLKALGAQKARAQAGLALAKRERIPDLPLSVQYSEEGTGQNAIQPPTTTFGVSLTVPLFYQYQGEVAKAGVDVKTQELQEAKVQAQVVSDVSKGFAAYLSARSQAERMDGSLLGSARRARDLVRIQYEKGAASLLELLDAQRTLIATNVERIQGLQNYWTAVFALEEAVGADLRP